MKWMKALRQGRREPGSGRRRDCGTRVARCVPGLVALAAAAAFAGAAPAEQVVHPLPAPGPLDNPLKGWCPYTTTGPVRQPYSMLFRYLSWKELEPHRGKFAFQDWERALAADPQARGKHVVLRVYADYPGRPSGLPSWLLSEGVKTTPYTDYGGGSSPDYSDPRLVRAMESFIAALGRRYGRNPRISFVELGLLGFWGEWHTFPHSELFAPEDTQQRVITAYRKAFPRTMLLARYPRGAAGREEQLGYHDDLFPMDTAGPDDWRFFSLLQGSHRSEAWQRAPIAGEMVPGAAPEWLGSEFSRTLEAATTGHFSWLGPYCPALESDQTPELTARGAELVRRMGYEFSLQEVRHPRVASRHGRLPVRIDGANQGIAPFYYPWKVSLALIDTAGRPAQQLPLPVDIRTWLPGRFEVAASPRLNVAPGHYRLALGILDPWTRRPSIGLANDLPHRGGWNYLSTVEVR